MARMTNEILMQIVDYIITPPFHNINQSAEHFGFSRSTVSAHLKRISNPNDEVFDFDKSKLVCEALECLLSEARSLAGAKSKREVIFTQAQALELRFKNLYQRIPQRTLAEQYGCSHMTICKAINGLSEAAKMVQDEEVKKMFEKEREDTFRAEFMADRILDEDEKYRAEGGSPWKR